MWGGSRVRVSKAKKSRLEVYVGRNDWANHIDSGDSYAEEREEIRRSEQLKARAPRAPAVLTATPVQPSHSFLLVREGPVLLRCREVLRGSL